MNAAHAWSNVIDRPAPRADNPLPYQQVPVLDTQMAYVDIGEGDPIVFLHGNPTSSYLWRNVIPHVAGLGRCLAPDLVGMGRSGPMPSGRYGFLEHARYLQAWFAALQLERVTLVLHDWGSALGFHYAQHHPQSIAAIAYMESLVQPRRWSDFPTGRDTLFRTMRGPDGERLVLEHNFFVETVLPKSVLRALGEAEMAAYRAPFPTPESRRPTLAFPRELPIDDEPDAMAALVASYGEWMAGNDLPKLFVNAEPGALLTGRAREFCRRWRNQREVTVAGLHYLQEDSPDEIGRALRRFVAELRGRD